LPAVLSSKNCSNRGSSPARVKVFDAAYTSNPTTLGTLTESSCACAAGARTTKAMTANATFTSQRILCPPTVKQTALTES
jgi:hypothetical protein